MLNSELVLGFSDYEMQSRNLAEALGLPLRLVEVHRFPDGESRVQIPPTLPAHVVICRSLDDPNHKLIELALTAETARTLGARTLTLVAPYLCYMRQDIAFEPGQAVSQQIIGRQLALLFNAVITVDPHLHRITQLEQAVPAANALALSAAPLMSEFLSENVENPYVLGPDSESHQWVEAIAQRNGFDYGVATKQRSGDRAVSITLPEGSFKARSVVLVDDVASTGRTVAGAARRALDRGARQVHAFVTHALFVDDAIDELKRAGVEHIWSTDSVTHPSNVISLADLLAEALLDQG